MKKLMLGLMMAFAVTAEAEVKTDVLIGDLKYSLDTEAKAATITGYTGSPMTVDVGEVEYEGQKYSVTSVGANAFYDCSSLASVSLPNATTIGVYAFWRCGSLTSISLPNATSVGAYAFFLCDKLTSVSLPNVVTIGSDAFRNCKSLTSVTLPNVVTIEGYAFQNCPLDSISLPKATSIGTYAFAYCALTSISLPNATTIGDSAFRCCESLTSVSLPNATTIGATAFSSCSSLASVSLPNATTVGELAFNGCFSLASVSLPNATTIGESAFDGCSSLETVTVKNRAMKSELENNRSNYKLGGGVTIVNGSLVETYIINDDLTAELESDGALTIIGSGDMSDWGSSDDQVWKDERGQIKSVIAAGVTSVGSYAFECCENLTSISLPNATSIGKSAFGSCSSFSKIIVTKEMKQTLEGDRSHYGIGNNVKIIYPPTLTEYQVKQATWGGALMSGDFAIGAADYDNACAWYDLTPKTEPQVVKEDEIAVKETEIQAAKAEAVTVADGVVSLGVTVNTNGNFTAETKSWAPVELKQENVEVKDGKIVISIPVSGDSGFMILQSGDAKVGANNAAPVAPIIEAEADVENPDIEGGN